MSRFANTYSPTHLLTYSPTHLLTQNPMGSTVRSIIAPDQPQQLTAGSLRWRNWPLVDQPAWSWAVPLGIFAVAFLVYWVSGSWFMATAAAAALAAAMRSFLLPTTFEVTSSGLRRLALGRLRLIPWQAIRAYQLRATGVLLFQRADPTTLDLPGGLFVPYPYDEDELLVAVRLYLPHAAELPS